MSRVVGCAGSSHSPMLASPRWELRGKSDRERLAAIYDNTGQPRTYAELSEEVGDRYLHELDPETWEHRYQRCMDAVERLGNDIARLNPDLLVVVGDDQAELFTERNNPAIALAYLDVIQAARPPDDADDETRALRERLGQDGKTYVGDREAAVHLIEHLMQASFDITAVGEMEVASGFGHAFTWVLGRLLRDTPIPSVPVLLNTYYPPNQPTPQRCFDLGQVLREACESLPGDRRVMVVASGGLSHFLVNPELDDTVLSAMRDHDVKALGSLPLELLKSGSSEIRNWITMSGASEGLDCQWTEYQPGYRTPAGTGVGLAFSLFS